LAAGHIAVITGAPSGIASLLPDASARAGGRVLLADIAEGH
jgi:NADP-dependent 3-hydroxy acid dehydrogenase YdfG